MWDTTHGRIWLNLSNFEWYYPGVSRTEVRMSLTRRLIKARASRKLVHGKGGLEKYLAPETDTAKPVIDETRAEVFREGHDDALKKLG